MLEELFEKINNEILTDEVKLQMSTLWESALNEAIQEKEVELEDQNRKELVEFKEDLANHIGEYLDYIVEEFIAENEEVIDNEVKVNTAKRVIETFQNVVESFNIQLAPAKVKQDTVAETLKVENNRLMSKLQEAKKEVEMTKKAAMIAEACADLTSQSAQDKLISLAESLEFDETTYAAKLGILAEQIKGSDVDDVSTLVQLEEDEKDGDAEVIVETVETKPSPMSEYLKRLKR